MDIAEAIEATAESDDPGLSKRSLSSGTRIAETRRMILRFLQNVPEHATVIELRHAIEDQE
jgi:hypothetical protein